MAMLPFELWSQIFGHLDTDDIVNCQRVSRAMLSYARDPVLWRQRLYRKTDICSKRQNFLALKTTAPPTTETDRFTIDHWDPRYPDEDLDFYREYVRRKAPVRSINWLPLPKHARRSKGTIEATGLNAVHDQDGQVQRLITPLDDGSICIWDLSRHGCKTIMNLGARSTPKLLVPGQGRSQSNPVNNIAVDSRHNHAYVAQQNLIHQIDLNTLQSVRIRAFPQVITAVSEYNAGMPLAVGTADSLYLCDSRAQDPMTAHLSNHGELQAVVFEPRSDALWVAGRFSHINVLDNRFFPRVRGYVPSGGQISSLSILPYPHLPHLDASTPLSLRLDAKHRSHASTLIAAGSYKGHGSLELYGVTPESPAIVTKSYNRHTASNSKLLSAVPHGASIAASTADGRIAWFERDGSALRTTTLPEDEMAKKLLPMTGPECTSTTGAADALFMWTAEGRVGVLTFGGCGVEVEEEHDERDNDSNESDEEERLHAERMRRALEAHSHEARFLRGLGLR